MMELAGFRDWMLLGGISIAAKNEAWNSSSVGSAAESYSVSSGVASRFSIGSNGSYLRMYVYDLGSAVQTSVQSGGLLYVSDGGVLSNTNIGYIGHQIINSGGTAVQTYVSSAGWQYVNASGSALQTVVSSGGYQEVAVDGYVNGTTVLSGGTMTVSGGVVEQTTLSGGLQLLSGGSVWNTTVLAGGSQVVYSSVRTESGIVQSRGSIIVSGGTATSTAVYTEGRLVLQGGAYASNTAIYGGGIVSAGAGTILAGVTLVAGSLSLTGATDGMNGIMNLYAVNRKTSDGVLVSGINNLSNIAYTLSISASPSAGDYKLASGSSFFLDSITVYMDGVNNPLGTISVGGDALDLGNYTGSLVISGSTLIFSVSDKPGSSYVDVTLGSGYASSSMILNKRDSSLRTTILAGGTQYVSSGGYASVTTISSGGLQVISRGGYASAVNVYNGGICRVIGSADSVEANGGGILSVSSGGMVSLLDISGGSVSLYAGAGVSGIELSSGVFSNAGGSAQNLWISGGTAIITNGQLTSVNVSAGGSMLVSGGSVTSLVQAAGGFLDLSISSYVSGYSEETGNSFRINNGVTSGLTSITSMALNVESGYRIDGQTIGNQAVQKVFNGASAFLAVAASGGTQCVYGGGIISGTVVQSGGRIIASSGSLIGELGVESGGLALLYRGAELISSQYVGGTYSVIGSVDANNNIIEFNLSERTGADGAIISNIGNIQNAQYALTITDSTAVGNYVLAKGADSFLQTISVGDGKGKVLNLAVGQTISINGINCSLTESFGTLTFSIGGSPEPAEYDVFINNFTGGTSDLLSTTVDSSVAIYRDASLWITKSLGDGWGVTGTGDFNGDGIGDFLVYHEASGSLGAWTMNADGSNGWMAIGNPLSSSWSILGEGDYDNNDISDILLYNSDWNYIGSWNLEPSGNILWKGYTQLSEGWQYAGTGDFNGDGRDDILVSHAQSGTVGAYLVQSDGSLVWQTVGNFDSSSWSLAGVGDFNADGIDDILLNWGDYNYLGGWLLNSSASVEGWGSFGQYDISTWTFSGVGDFNGDSTDDLLFATLDGDSFGARLITDGEVSGWLTVVA